MTSFVSRVKKQALNIFQNSQTKWKTMFNEMRWLIVISSGFVQFQTFLVRSVR